MPFPSPGDLPNRRIEPGVSGIVADALLSQPPGNPIVGIIHNILLYVSILLFPGEGISPGEGNGNHSSILAWRIPWTEDPGGL